MRHVLLVSDGIAYTSEQQFAPLLRHRRQIASQTGIVFSFMNAEDAWKLTPAQLQKTHAVGLKLAFSTPAAEAAALASHVFGGAKKAGIPTLFFDGDDDLSVLWPKVLAACDHYIKKHHFTDPQAYTAILTGKSNLTDYVHRISGRSFADDIIPVSGGLGAADIEKIALGWNIALDDKITDLARDLPADSGIERDIDLLCRASVPEEFWTFPMRDAAVQAIRSLESQYRINAPTDRVPPAEYYREMLRSRLCVSPFGFGEICWRDFEAMLCGCLLVKPDMSHVTTLPDLFVPHETYVPVSWDYSDFSAACAPYLADEGARRRVAETARTRLQAALTAEWFLARFETTMQKAGILPPKRQEE
ncbi:glycosyltransferase [Sedimentitalea sp. HM32M-2]|uniref:glycosyltransferase n=1 Tax=Sedimentitalea sp. HM32M-2 TaxID=3351566 RepID=UPI003636EE7B